MENKKDSLNHKKTEEKQNQIPATTTKQVKEKIKFNTSKNTFALLIITFVITAISLLSVWVSGGFNRSATIQVQASMNTIRVTQAKLYEMGYYSSAIDGKYSASTKTAIKSFQKDYSLQDTGELNQATLTALGVSDSEQTNSDLYLLAKLIYSEARGEIYTGQVAVGAVVLNRVDDAGFPNTLQGVIYQPWAFTALHDGQFNLEPNSTAYQAAQDAMNGWDPSYGSLYYYNPATATSSWIFTRTTVVVIGNHVFAI